MFQRVGKAPDAYPQERTKRWLSWLGRAMRQHSLTVFLLEDLQPSWLPSVRQRWVYAFSSRVSIALSWMILWWILSLALQPVLRQAMLPAEMAITVLAGAVAGIIAGAIVGVLLAVIVVIQQWPQLIMKNSTFMLGVILLPAVCVLAAIIVALLFAFVAALFSLFSPIDLPGRARPGQGVVLSAQNALLAGVAVAVSWGIPIAIINGLQGDANYLRDAAMAASAWGLAAAVWYGGLDVIEHITLRFLLRRHGYVPKNYVGFLDYATRLIFLQKVGSGYIFVHRQLLDYFFELPAPETKPGIEFLEAGISERHREEEKRGVEQQPESEIACAPSPVDAERAAEAEQRAKDQREGFSKLRRRLVLAAGAVVAAWTVGVLILLALWFFWEDQANRCFNAKDYGKAREWYQKGADAGNALAMNNLGWLHQNGRASPKITARPTSGTKSPPMQATRPPCSTWAGCIRTAGVSPKITTRPASGTRRPPMQATRPP